MKMLIQRSKRLMCLLMNGTSKRIHFIVTNMLFMITNKLICFDINN